MKSYPKPRASPISFHYRLHVFLLLSFFFAISSVTASASASALSYSKHCSSVVPESTPTVRENVYYALRTRLSYFNGGDRIFGKVLSDVPKSFSFRTTQDAYKTETNGVYKISATLTLRSPNLAAVLSNISFDYGMAAPRRSSRRSLLRFVLDGFWSESSGKFCLVGSAKWFSREGKSLTLNAVFRLNHAKNSTILSSFVTGRLDSLNSQSEPSYFEPISMLAFPAMAHYKYTLASKVFDVPNGIEIPHNQSIGFPLGKICSMHWDRTDIFSLDYASNCKHSRNCSPFGEVIGYLPKVMSMYAIQCSESEQKLRYLIEFPPNISYTGYFHTFNPNTTLVGEGSWDSKTNRLSISACRISNATTSLGNARVEDCSTRLSLLYPAVWTIRNSVRMIGEIRTNKTVKDSGHFDRILFRSSDNYMDGLPGVRYEYTELDSVKKLCPIKKSIEKTGKRYPDEHSYDLNFDMSLQDSNERIAWGSARPFTVGDKMFGGYTVIAPEAEPGLYDFESNAASSVVETNNARSYSGPLNISYKISFSSLLNPKSSGRFSSYNFSLNANERVEISAEGSYDSETGYLCMIGCKELNQSNQISKSGDVDCQIHVTVQFPSQDSKNEKFIRGSIESLRKKSDPLYFRPLNISSAAFYDSDAKQSIWRMDLEITMMLVSNTLVCVLVGLQLVYVKKNPDVLPFISIVTLVILTLGYMIPLVLNFEALFFERHRLHNLSLGAGGWLEGNEVIVRGITMVAFLLLFRLLQLTWTARLGDENGKVSWVAEKRALFVCFPLYFLGGLIALCVNWNKNRYGSGMLSSSEIAVEKHSPLGDLRSYAGLVLDSFLFPQILLNVFRFSKEKALSHVFYLGVTFVRLLPHAYDFYRNHHYVQPQFDESYLYADPSADFYSSAWDLIIPCCCLLLAAIVFFQQRLGGRCILPRRFRQLETYEKVSTTDTSQL